MISELKQFNISYEKLEVIAEEIENETLKLKLKDLSKIYKQFEFLRESAYFYMGCRVFFQRHCLSVHI